MTSWDAQTIKDKVTLVRGLVFACPFGDELEDCPVKDLRAGGVEDALGSVAMMKESLLDELIAHHSQCMKRRGGL